MHDPVYRLSVAWQNVVYNQPPHLGFYIGDGIDSIPWPDIYTPEKKVIDSVKKPYMNDLKIYSFNDGSVYLSSGEMISSVSAYSVTGVLLHHNSKINMNSYTFSIKKDHSVIIVKVETKSGMHTVKVVH